MDNNTQPPTNPNEPPYTADDMVRYTLFDLENEPDKMDAILSDLDNPDSLASRWLRDLNERLNALIGPHQHDPGSDRGR